MFDTVLGREAGSAVGPLRAEDWFDPEWLEEWPDSTPPEPPGSADCAPSGWLALELDQGSVDPARLPDAELIDAVIGFDRLASWASARQARLLAEFARRRPADSGSVGRGDEPSLVSEFACDEVGLALRLSRSAATGRVAMAETLAADLPGTLAAWDAGAIDTLKARAITEASYLLAPQQRAALEARVLERAGRQTVSRLRAALGRAVLALDPEGAQQRYARRRQERRVVVSPDEDGMASLWALLSAPDATAAYQRLGDLARSLGAEERRPDLGHRTGMVADELQPHALLITQHPARWCAHGHFDPPVPAPCGAPDGGHWPRHRRGGTDGERISTDGDTAASRRVSPARPSSPRRAAPHTANVPVAIVRAKPEPDARTDIAR